MYFFFFYAQPKKLTTAKQKKNNENLILDLNVCNIMIESSCVNPPLNRPVLTTAYQRNFIWCMMPTKMNRKYKVQIENHANYVFALCVVFGCLSDQPIVIGPRSGTLYSITFCRNCRYYYYYLTQFYLYRFHWIERSKSAIVMVFIRVCRVVRVSKMFTILHRIWMIMMCGMYVCVCEWLSREVFWLCAGEIVLHVSMRNSIKIIFLLERTTSWSN